MPTAADPVTEAARVDAVSRKRTLKPMRTARVVSNNEVCADRFAACASIEVLLPWMRSPRKSDTSFGGDGTVLTRFGAREDTWAMDVAQQPDGKIVAAGSTGDEFALVRYREADGSTRRLATTEGSERTSTAVSTKPGSLAIQANGRIVLAGVVAPPESRRDTNFGLARYRANGELDRTFSRDGKQRTRFGPNNQDYGNDLALQADGRIIIVGAVTLVPDESDFGLARYLSR